MVNEILSGGGNKISSPLVSIFQENAVDIKDHPITQSSGNCERKSQRHVKNFLQSASVLPSGEKP